MSLVGADRIYKISRAKAFVPIVWKNLKNSVIITKVPAGFILPGLALFNHFLWQLGCGHPGLFESFTQHLASWHNYYKGLRVYLP